MCNLSAEPGHLTRRDVMSHDIVDSCPPFLLGVWFFAHDSILVSKVWNLQPTQDSSGLGLTGHKANTLDGLGGYCPQHQAERLLPFDRWATRVINFLS